MSEPLQLIADLQKLQRTPDPSYALQVGELLRRLSQSELESEKRSPAAVCLLFRGQNFQEAELLLTLRSPQVSTHANQVAFPGGGLEAQDDGDFHRAAVRECFEEVGIPSDFILPLGQLEVFPTLGGPFLVTPVVAALRSGSTGFTLQPEEVVHAEWVPVKKLISTREVEVRTFFETRTEVPVFWWGEHRMWGLSALIFDSILNRYVNLEP
jgi:8-oxo-dGTP pyrophosphatase MutT (NUDIX family)